MFKFKDDLIVFLNFESDCFMLICSRKGFFVMTHIGLTIIFPQLQELIECLHMIVMEDSSDLIADEQFVRLNMRLLYGKS
jgi:hypothetical protein